MAYVRKTFEEMEEDSYTRAIEQRIIVEQINDEECLVTNLEYDTTYTVSLDNDYVTDCDCPHHIYRGVTCKHMIVASLELGKLI